MVVTMQDAADQNNKNFLLSFKTMADTITSYAQDSGSGWPNVTLPFFETLGDDARSMALSNYFAFCPIVMEPGRTHWEAYAVDNQWWLIGNQTQAYTPKNEKALSLAVQASGGIPEYIHKLESGRPTVVDLGPGPYTPRWQMSPIPVDPFPVNFDVLSSRGIMEFFDVMIAARWPVLSGLVNEEYVESTVIHPELNFTDHAPKSIALSPIFESFDQASDIMGIFEIVVDWKLMIQNLLPDGKSGVFYVLNCSCSEDLHTFELNHGDVQYIGDGNLHDVFYSHIVQEVQLTTSWGGLNGTRPPCVYSLLVYPSSELRAAYSSITPEIVTAIVAVIFFVMAFVFFSYDKYVQRWNQKVFRQAVKTNAIVSSFFPKQIRDRLFNNDTKSDENSKRRRSSSNWTKQLRLKTYMSDGDDGTSVTTQDGGPIADLFPNCTVLFADIAGKFHVRNNSTQLVKATQHLCFFYRLHRMEFDAGADAGAAASGMHLSGF
jgi:hypothetical protein